jgi:hypothetical protein
MFLNRCPLFEWVIHLIELVLEEDILRARERAASMDSAPTSNTLIPNGADTEAGRTTDFWRMMR